MTTVQISPGPLGGLIQGAFGNYVQASDGTMTVDTRDVPPLLAKGAAYLSSVSNVYTTPIAPAAATLGTYFTNTISNGSLTVTAPDVMRQMSLIFASAASPSQSAGTVALTYKANDGTTQTDVFSQVVNGVTPATYFTSKGVAALTMGLAAGTGAGTITLSISSTTYLSVPVAQGAVDFAVYKEVNQSANQTLGTVSTVTLGSYSPHTAPNASNTYSMGYVFLAPQV